MSQLNLVVWRPQARWLTHTRERYHEQISHSAHARFIIELRVTQCKTEIKQSPTEDPKSKRGNTLEPTRVCPCRLLQRQSCPVFSSWRKSVQTPALTISMNMLDQRADSVSTASACNLWGRKILVDPHRYQGPSRTAFAPQRTFLNCCNRGFRVHVLGDRKLGLLEQMTLNM